MKTLDRFALDGRLALVTGGGSGLGLAMARGLAEAGATVVLNGRKTARLEAAAAGLVAAGLRAETAVFDVTDPAAVNAAIGALETRLGGVDILVNNAGMTRRGPVESLSDDDWRTVMATNLDAAFYLSRAVVPAMKKKRRGAIVNTCSLMSTLARPTTLPYAASKGGMAMLTRGLAVELAPFGIRVNGVAPGYFRTDLTAALSADAEFDAWLCKRTPAGRWGDVDELAGVAVFLAS
ncbi:MAG TPA: SDR family NAD(P)-dependent oxidoreductase, partial [Caldimonas sp.]|nr:SDR family NAD(P)-dependent oxidoreductase [Caldimonas sp.]